MNPLTQTDLQTYLHRLIKENLPPQKASAKRSSHHSAAPLKHKTGSNNSAKGKGDNP